jgi:hypothetical protein
LEVWDFSNFLHFWQCWQGGQTALMFLEWSEVSGIQPWTCSPCFALSNWQISCDSSKFYFWLTKKNEWESTESLENVSVRHRTKQCPRPTVGAQFGMEGAERTACSRICHSRASCTKSRAIWLLDVSFFVQRFKFEVEF